jgi:maltooligosyltrehalose trehalohydrolase
MPLIATLKDGWFYQGQYSVHRGRRHGNSPCDIDHSRFVVCNQNHDQVGNRALGDRLNAQVNFEAMKLAAGVTLLSPFTPLLFMGEEYGEPAPFQYFTSHGDPALVEAVRKGRREEFAAFDWHEEVPDPQDEKTFARSRLDHSLKEKKPHSTMLRFYRRLISIRKERQLAAPQSQQIHELGGQSFLLMRQHGCEQTAIVFNFEDHTMPVGLPYLAGDWNVLISSADSRWQGPLSNLADQLNLSASSELQLSPFSFIAISRSRERNL